MFLHYRDGDQVVGGFTIEVTVESDPFLAISRQIFEVMQEPGGCATASGDRGFGEAGSAGEGDDRREGAAMTEAQLNRIEAELSLVLPANYRALSREFP